MQAKLIVSWAEGFIGQDTGGTNFIVPVIADHMSTC